MMHYLSYSSLLICIYLLIGSNAFVTKLLAQHPADTFPIQDLCQVDLNRTATKLTAAELQSVSPATLGFSWQSDDASTLKWRPQGITAINKGCKKFVAVSWYGRYINYPFPCNGQNVDYRNRGSRISFVDITDLDSITYRHVLLVDENYNTFYDMHAGGILILNDTLYVPDSRSAIDALYAFPLDQIKQIPSTQQANFYNYGYLLAKVPDADSLPINPSFISYDWDEGQILAGAFQNCDPINCNTPSQNTLMWFDPAHVDRSSPFYDNVLGKMQGVGSANQLHSTLLKDIWVSTSYGASNNSELYTFHYDFAPNTQQNQSLSIGDNYAIFDLPPGIEDIHLSPDNDTIWTLTEFSPNHPPCASISSNERYVFAFLRDDIRPPGACRDTIYTIQQNTISDTSLCSPDSLHYIAFTDQVAYAQFDKSDNTWFEINSLSTPLANSDRSVFVWVKLNSAVSNESQILMGINTSTGGNICNLQINTSQLVGIYDGTTSHYSTTPIADGQWHHVGYTYQQNSGMTRIYVDGQNEFSFIQTQTATPTSYFSLGQEYDSGLSTSNFFEGQLTEASIWDTVLTASDISLLMQASIQSDHPQRANLVAYYPMYKTCGSDLTILDDLSGNNHQGTGYGMIGNRGIDMLSVDRLDQIPGFNSADHFSISWKQDSTLLSTGKILSLIEGNYAAGPYTLEISRAPFKIIDNWTIQFVYSYALDSLTRCESLTWIDGITYTSDTIVNDFTISNYIGCDSIVTLNLSITNIDTSIQQIGTNLQAVQSAAIYQWLDCDINSQAISGATSQGFSPSSNGNYAVEIRLNNCVDTSSCIPIIGLSNRHTHTSEPITIYPNPTRDELTVTYHHEDSWQSIQLKTFNGKQVPLNLDQKDGLLHIQFQLPSGIYFLELVSKNHIQVHKITVY